MKKLFIGNIPYTATEDQMGDLFSEVGTVASVAIIKDRDSGRSKGFGFVEYEEDSEADKAIEKFNGHEMDGRSLIVNEARPPRPRNDRFGSRF